MKEEEIRGHAEGGMAVGKSGDLQVPRVQAGFSQQESITERSAGTDAGSRAGFDALLGDIPLELSVELGRTTLSLREIHSQLGPGSIIPLEKLTGDPLDIRVNARLVARGEAVAIGERYGIRIVHVLGEDGEPR